MHRISTIVLIMAFVLTLAPHAGAAELVGRGDISLGLDFGGAKFDSTFDDDTNARGALRVGYFLTDNLEIEVEAARTDLNILSSDLGTYTLNAAWSFQRGSNFVPYFAIGAGIAEYRFDEFLGDQSIDDSGLALKGAVGTRVFFGQFDRVALRLEAAVQSIDILDDTETSVNFGAGVVFRFGD
jgi:opacity protein-like surface antigen